jgi:hypothetical protein
MRVIGLIYILLLLSVVCYAQDDSIYKKEPDTTIYKIGFTGTGNINKTAANGTSYIFNNAIRFNVEKRILTVNAFANWIYGQNPLRKTNNDYLFIVDADLFKNTRKLYYWGLAGYEKSLSLKIYDRYQFGGGLGYTLVNSDKFNLVLSDGLLYEKSALREVDKYGRTGYETVRNSFRLKNRLKIHELITIDGVHFLQHSLSDKEDYIIRTTNTISFHIKKWISLTVGLTYNKLNFTEAENLLFNYGLTLENVF